MRLTTLRKTWIFDLDGSLVKHNGYLSGEDSLLPGVRDFFGEIDNNDYILILTARKEEYREVTTEFLKKENIRYTNILFEIPSGERILFNDNKPSGLSMAYAVNLKRDTGIQLNVILDELL